MARQKSLVTSKY